MGPDYHAEFQELNDGDLNVHGEEDSDAGSRLRLGRIGAAGRARNEPTTGQRGGAVSWIWSAVRAEDQEPGLHDAVRIQWAKALARKDRWHEEVRLLREEMKRVLRSLVSLQREWQERVDCGRAVEAGLANGMAAYAKRQVALHAHIAKHFVNHWRQPGKAVVEAVMRKDLDVYERLAAGEEEVVGGSIAELE
ncbi:hypothetical protein MIND_00917100 [Mycena indigotica]|uniref:Uncharacterized protein n=1 Tax=Mycena indigotica TaxID=2126181 RepID=A0A8H6SDB9_9AGAR|nr:uncharacterized protein MIND_00917100 [Mycena indigotica]KAF7296858.1 hypothetical protein MIND_00917100 [Mycena indigotica]